MTSASMAARRSLSAFRHRNYRLFFWGQAISLVGTWMQQVAQGWLVLQISGGNPLWLGVVAAAQFVPVMILGLFGGILADVLPKRQTLLAVQVAMMSLAIVLAVLTATGIVTVWMVVILAVLLGIASAVDMPVRQSFAYELVGPRDVGNAVSWGSAMFNGARVVGPAVAGLTIGAFGIAVAFAINAASFLAVIVGLAMMRDTELFGTRLIPAPRTVGAVLDNLAEGLRYVRHTPIVLLAVTVVGLVATFGMNFTVIVPPLAADVLRSDASGYGFLMTAMGIGALSAAIGLVVAGKPRPSRIALGATILGVGSLALALSTSFPVSLLLMIPIGAGGIAMAATANATIQLHVPDGLRGRVMSVYTTVFAASVPIGGLAAGSLAATIGILPTILVGGSLSLATGIAAAIWYQRIKAAGRVAPIVAASVPSSTAVPVPAPETTATVASVQSSLMGRPSIERDSSPSRSLPASSWVNHPAASVEPSASSRSVPPTMRTR